MLKCIKVADYRRMPLEVRTSTLCYLRDFFGAPVGTYYMKTVPGPADNSSYPALDNWLVSEGALLGEPVLIKFDKVPIF